MGGTSGKRSLTEVQERVSKRMGRIQVSARYHYLPKSISDDYHVNDTVLGTGIGGSVVQATSSRASRTPAKNFAVKTLSLNSLSARTRNSWQSEVEIFLTLDHPNVCRLYDVYESASELVLVMECLEGGELHDRIQKCKRFSEREAAKTVHQMLLAVNYLHSLDIVHRDLKLENFLYDAEGGDRLKLIDFGFGKVWRTNRKMKSRLGTVAYIAPEVIRKSYTNTCDLWSLGVISFVLLAGYMPFPIGDKEDRTMQLILNGEFSVNEDKWAAVSGDAFAFVKRLLDNEPDRRLTAEQAFAHPWLARQQLVTKSAVDRSIFDALSRFADASRLRRACMRVMAWSLATEELATVQDAFVEMDHDSRGTITLQALKQVLVERFDVGPERVHEIFQALDATNTGVARYSDFLAAMLGFRIQIRDDLALAAFQRFDKDSTGVVTMDNVRQVVGPTLDGEALENLVAAEADFMTSGKLSPDGYLEYLRRSTAHEAPTRAVGFVARDGWSHGGTGQSPSTKRSSATKVQTWMRERVALLVRNPTGGAVAKSSPVGHDIRCQEPRLEKQPETLRPASNADAEAYAYLAESDDKSASHRLMTI